MHPVLGRGRGLGLLPRIRLIRCVFALLVVLRLALPLTPCLSAVYVGLLHLLSRSAAGRSKIFMFFCQTALFLISPIPDSLSW